MSWLCYNIMSNKMHYSIIDLVIDSNSFESLCLKELEKLIRDNNRSLKDFDCMPHPNFDDIKEFENRLLLNELNVDTNSMKELHENHLSKLNFCQRKVYDKVVDAVNNKIGGFFFVYGYGSTGKTFVSFKWYYFFVTTRRSHCLFLICYSFIIE